MHEGFYKLHEHIEKSVIINDNLSLERRVINSRS